MINQQLISFIKQQLQLGLTKEKISSELLANGWTTQDIEEGFTTINLAQNIPVSPYSNLNKPTTDIKPKKYSTKKILFIIILILLVLAFAVSVYSIRGVLDLPIIRDLM